MKIIKRIKKYIERLLIDLCAPVALPTADEARKVSANSKFGRQIIKDLNYNMKHGITTLTYDIYRNKDKYYYVQSNKTYFFSLGYEVTESFDSNITISWYKSKK